MYFQMIHHQKSSDLPAATTTKVLRAMMHTGSLGSRASLSTPHTVLERWHFASYHSSNIKPENENLKGKIQT